MWVVDRNGVLSAVHERFSGSSPDFPNGFAEHAPMGAEAMLELGIGPDAVDRWAGRHRPEPLAADSPLIAIRDGLRHELDTDAWDDVLRRHVEQLIDHLDAHLFHGLIRTAHASRALMRVDSSAGRHELATALASWHVWAEGSSANDIAPGAAGRPDDLDGVIDAARRGAAAFVTKGSIFTLHAVTAPMAFLLLADLVDTSTHGRAAAAFERTHRRHPTAGPDRSSAEAALPSARPSAASIAALADAWDAHPAKLVEAALRGHDLTGDAVFLEAAAAVMR